MATKRKTRIGNVVSTKMEKTAVVVVETLRRHPLYKKNIRGTVRYKVHDENSKCRLGDRVRIEETRPLSREKRWRVDEVLTKAEMVEFKPEEIE